MPKLAQFCLTVTTVHEGYISDDGIWVVYGFKREPGEVTHWTAMPEYPDDEED